VPATNARGARGGRRLPPQARYTPATAIRAYELMREGKSEDEVRTALNARPPRWARWKREFPALAEALERGRKKFESITRGPAATQPFMDFVAGRLPPAIRDLWDRICEYETADNPEKKLDAFFARHGKRVRQWLFLHAYVVSNFNASEACRRVNVSYNTLEEWCRTEPEFERLVTREMHRAKQDFVEAALLGKVAAGDPTCIVHASKTLNASRGYGVQKDRTTNVNAGVTLNQTTVNVDLKDLNDLPVEQRAAILDALERKALPPKDVTNG
jgi:hypothetical protein